MMIYINGDSWTAGWPLEEMHGHREHSWPHLISKLTGENVINDARSGCSNYRIYRRTFDYILKNRPTLSIVCLTSWFRLELGDVESGNIYQYMPMAVDTDVYRKYWNPYLEYSNFLRQIVSLQSIAEANNTKLYFLDTFNDNLNRCPTYEWFVDILKLGNIFDKLNDERIAKKYQKIIDLNEHINYNMFISDKSYEHLINGCKLVDGHPVEEGHSKIANIIYNVIKKDI